MSGHSKWSTIKRKKGVKDVERGKLFSKLSRLITLAVVEGGGVTDPAGNVKLASAIARARTESMPKDNIQRAIERGGGAGGAAMREVVYEAFAHGGVGLLIEAATDNANRTLSEVRNTLDRGGGKLGSQGSVSYLFTRCGVVNLDKANAKEDAVMEFAAAVDAIDIDEDEVGYRVYLPFEAMGRVKDALSAAGLPEVGAEIDYKPQATITVEERAQAKALMNLIENVEGLDDVVRVYGNFDIPDEYIQ